MSSNLFYFPAVRGVSYCVPAAYKELEGTFPIYVDDDCLASSRITRGCVLVACELRPTDLLLDGDLVLFRGRRTRLVKRVFFENDQLRLQDDTGSRLFRPTELKADARVVHVCMGCGGEGCGAGPAEIIEPRGVATWRAGPNGMNTWVSPEWLKLFNAPAVDGIGAGWLRYIHPDDCPRLAQTWVEGILNGVSYTLTSRVMIRGEYELMTASSYPVKGARGQILGWEGKVHEAEDKVVNF